MVAELYPPVTEELLGELVRCISGAGEPLKIVLFGSHAREDAGPNSDLDILIIGESELPRYRRASRYLRALVGLFPAKDIVVWTPAEVAEWKDVSNAFISTALREGRLLSGPADPARGLTR